MTTDLVDICHDATFSGPPARCARRDASCRLHPHDSIQRMGGMHRLRQEDACLSRRHSRGLRSQLGRVPGVLPANILVIGGGVVGTNSARVACGMGANVTILDRSIERMKEIDDCFGPQIKTAYSSIETINELSKQADMIIGAVLIPGAKAPKLIERSQLSRMKKGAVLVDVAIDQGGCFETSKPTTHDDPIYEVDGIVHYCVANMPGAVARTSTMALNNATLPFIMQIAEKGWAKACLDNPHLKNGLNVHKGKIAYEAVASSLGEKYYSPDELIHNE